MPPFLVSSTGGKVATCYHPIYKLAFLPFIFAALITVAWLAYMLAISSFSGLNCLEGLYGGMNPYKGVVSSIDLQDTEPVWVNEPIYFIQALWYQTTRNPPMPIYSIIHPELSYISIAVILLGVYIVHHPLIIII